jgi:hypothetical protein
MTAIVGALLALLPRPEKPVQIPIDSEIERLRQENAQIARSHARLVDHIERLEREILTEQHLCTHWRETAQRIAKQSREEREALAHAQVRQQVDWQAVQAGLLPAGRPRAAGPGPGPAWRSQRRRRR